MTYLKELLLLCSHEPATGYNPRWMNTVQTLNSYFSKYHFNIVTYCIYPLIENELENNFPWYKSSTISLPLIGNGPINIFLTTEDGVFRGVRAGELWEGRVRRRNGVQRSSGVVNCGQKSRVSRRRNDSCCQWFVYCCNQLYKGPINSIIRLISHVNPGYVIILYRDGGTCCGLQTRPLHLSLYLFPTPPSVLHHCRAWILELSNRRLSNSRLSNCRLSNSWTVDSRSLELSYSLTGCSLLLFAF
jgi:hypothetical protein